MPLDIDDADKAAIIALLKETIAADRFPFSPRIRTFKRIFDKLEPPPPPERLPPPKPPGKPSLLLAKKRRR